MPKNTRTATHKHDKHDRADRAGHFTHNATFAHMTETEFRSEQWRQINALLVWQANLAAAGERGVVR